MKKKYKLTDETKVLANGVVLHRIKALRDFWSVHKGDLGGWIENEDNLHQEGNCWVGEEACVYGNALVTDNAVVRQQAQVYDGAFISGNSSIGGQAQVYDGVCTHGNAMIVGNAKVYHYAKLYDSCSVIGKSKVRGTHLAGSITIEGESYISEVEIVGDVMIIDAIITSIRDFIIFKNWWSSGRMFVWTRSNNMWSVGCFHGTGEELIKRAYRDSEVSGREYKKIVEYVEGILKRNN